MTKKIILCIHKKGPDVETSGRQLKIKSMNLVYN
jgi:hypothetical protein